MSEHSDAQDRLYVRGLLAEAGIEETAELVEALVVLRSKSRAPVPEPEGELAALFEGTPVPLRPRGKGGRGIILGAALIGAMAVGAGGVAANPDFLVRADPSPVVTFTPEVPTLGRAEPAEPEEPVEPVAPAGVTGPQPEPVVEDSPAPDALSEAGPEPEPEPEPEAEPEPEPEVIVVHAPVVEPGVGPLPGVGAGVGGGDGRGPVLDPRPGRDRHPGYPGHHGDRGEKRSGAGMPDRHGSPREDSGRGNGQGNDGHSRGRGPSGPGR